MKSRGLLTVVILFSSFVVNAGGPVRHAKVTPTPEFTIVETRILLSRELAKSFDKVTGSKKKGLCGRKSEELGQLLRALQSEMDSRKVSDKTIESIFTKHKTCNAACRKSLCASEVFGKIDAAKSNYGSAKDGM